MLLFNLAEATVLVKLTITMSEIIHLISADELDTLIRGCTLNNRESQRKMYNSFYSYGMAICDSHTKYKEDSIEIFNDGFLKIFKEIHRYKAAYIDELSSFKGWLRKIMTRTAIDYNRKYHKHSYTGQLDTAMIFVPAKDEGVFDMISYDEIIRTIRKLSPAYGIVLNMFIVDGLAASKFQINWELLLVLQNQIFGKQGDNYKTS